MGHIRIGTLVVLAVALAVPARAQTLADVPPLPWRDDMILTMKVMPELERGGIKALAPHVPDFEAALIRARPFFPDGVVAEGKRYMLVDGEEEAQIAMARARILAKTDGTTSPAVPLGNPYSVLGKELGVYYDEIGRYEDAVRVLDQTLALSPDPAALKGGLTGGLLSEKGFALGALKRYADALAVYEMALPIPALTTKDRARLYRGKGFILTDMDKLDEALAAYRESLKLEPGNPRALNEIAYIERLQAGGSKLPSTGVLPSDTPPPAGSPLRIE